MINDYLASPRLGGDILFMDTGVYVVPQRWSLRRGDPLVLNIVLPADARPTMIRVDLAKVQWRRTDWAWQSGAVPQRRGIYHTVRFDNFDLPEGVYTVSQIGISSGDPNATNEIVRVRALDGFPRVFLAVTEEPLLLLSPSRLRDRVAAIEAERRRLSYKGSVADIERPGIGRFRACVLVTRCLLTKPLRLEQVDLIPLKEGLRGVEELMVLNRLLGELRFRIQIPLGGPRMEGRKRDFPLTAISFRLIWAIDHDQVMRFVDSLTSATLAVLSGHRQARGEVIATVVESLDTGKGSYVPGYPPYQGNLLGGFISGEDPNHIEEQLGRVRKDRILDLFSTMHAEAIAEREPNFAYFRYWNLLEAIATRRISGRGAVVDFSGVTIRDGAGRPVTTSRARGRVYELIRRHFTKRRLSDATFQGQLGGKSLWEICGPWLAFRNATAHFGGFRRDDRFQQTHFGDWKTAEGAYDEIIARGGEFGTFSDPYYMVLRESARLIVSWEIDGTAI